MSKGSCGRSPHHAATSCTLAQPKVLLRISMLRFLFHCPKSIFLQIWWKNCHYRSNEITNLKIQEIAAITKSSTLYTLLLSSHCNSTTESLQKRPLVYYNSRHSALTLERGVFILGLRYILLWTLLGLRTYGASKHSSVLGSLVRAMEKKVAKHDIGCPLQY